MAKLAINLNGATSFKLSNVALEAIAKAKGWTTVQDVIAALFQDAFETFLLKNKSNNILDVKLLDWSQLTLDCPNIYLEKDESEFLAYINAYMENKRHDTDLIDVIEHLGTMASGKNADIHIVEIPDDVFKEQRYKIKQFFHGSAECVVEIPRMWGCNKQLI